MHTTPSPGHALLLAISIPSVTEPQVSVKDVPPEDHDLLQARIPRRGRERRALLEGSRRRTPLHKIRAWSHGAKQPFVVRETFDLRQAHRASIVSLLRNVDG